MQILKDHQDRLLTAQPFKLSQQRRKGALLFALWAQLEWCETSAAGQRQQLHQQRDVAGLGRRREQRRQLVEFCLWPVVARETGSTFELSDHRIEQAVLVVRRAEIAHADMGLGFDVLGKCSGEARPAGAWLAGEQHHSSFAAFRLLPAAQQLDFLLTTDKRRLSRAQRLEAADLAAHHSPDALRPTKAGKLLRSEVFQI